MAALITSVLGHPGKTAEYIMHLRDMEIELLPPDINEGFSHFSVKDNKIRFGLSAIRNVGKGIVDNMVLEREKNGPFRSLTDYCTRMESKDLNKRVIESLIHAGAFDSIGGTRKQYIQGYKSILDSILIGKKSTLSGQIDLFGFGGEEVQPLEDQLPAVGEFEEDQLLSNEKDVLGIYISGHPLDKFESVIKRKVTHRSFDFNVAESDAKEDEAVDVFGTEKNLEGPNLTIFDGQRTVIAGIVHLVTKKTTRNNAMMAFVELEDMYGTVEVIVFPKHYERFKHLFEVETKLIVEGRISVQEDQPTKVILDSVYELEQLINEVKYLEKGVKVWLKFLDDGHYMGTFEAIDKVLSRQKKGTNQIILYIERDNKKKSYPTHLEMTETGLQEIAKIIGENAIKIT